MWLVTREAGHLTRRRILGINWPGHGVEIHRVSHVVLQRQDGNLVGYRQLHCAVEDGDHVLALKLHRNCVGPMALEAKRVNVGSPQQVCVVASVRLVTGGTARLGYGLVGMCFFHLISLLGMACQASVYRIGLHKARRLSRVRIMASDTVALRPGMLNFCFVDFCSLLAVTSHA